MTFTDSATAQGSMPVNGTGFQYYEWTSEAHSHLPLSQDSVQLRYTELAAINWASLSSYGNEATAHSRNQTGSKHPQVVVGVQNQSIPNYRPNKCSHDDGHACDTTFVPPTMTARLEQLEGSSRPVNDPALRNSVPKTPTPTTPSPTRTRRRRRRRRTPPTAPITDIMLTEERICKYVSRKGKPCGLNMASIAGWKVARHWYSCHAMKEWKQIQKKMVMAEATIMNTPARLQVGNSYAARCPFTFCRHPNNPNKRYMRPDSLNRHMRACAKDYNANTSTRVEEKVSASALQSASRCAQSNMRLGQYDQEEFGDEYQAAVWTIHHA
ncbi:hypothetical protein JB92DRAFT_3060796 [Gautieria morchelliformis]|nr:hypothetical protein JB92DRAFT_3060796 [Gautieria morchelliformis]